jgi:hypothetical protein
MIRLIARNEVTSGTVAVEFLTVLPGSSLCLSGPVSTQNKIARIHSPRLAGFRSLQAEFSTGPRFSLGGIRRRDVVQSWWARGFECAGRQRFPALLGVSPVFYCPRWWLTAWLTEGGFGEGVKAWRDVCCRTEHVRGGYRTLNWCLVHGFRNDDDTVHLARRISGKIFRRVSLILDTCRWDMCTR